MDNIFELDESWNGITTIIPFGYGRIGRRVSAQLRDFFEIPFVIDNNKALKSNSNVKLLTLEEAKDKIKNRKIVVLTTELAYSKIRNELCSYGYVENKDFTILSRFLGEYFLKNEDKIFLSKLDTIITSRCSLKCPHCAGFIPYCKDAHDVPFERLCQNFDTVFSSVDYVLEYCLLGGEPFLYKDLVALIEYLMSTYGDKIGKLVLISNGNVDITNDDINVIKKYNIKIAVSDYTESVNYKKRYDKFLDLLEKNDIEYSINKELVWKDHGYPSNPAKLRDDEVRSHMEACGHTCPSAFDGKIYYCDGMVSAELMTGYTTAENDVIDIAKMQKSSSENEVKTRIFSYLMGDINRSGYPSFCSLCRGIGEDNKNIVKPGM